MAIKEYNVDLDIKGRVLASIVPNSTGSIVTWNATTNVFGLRTNAQIISDLNLSSNYITTNTTQTELTGNKTSNGIWTLGQVRKAGQTDTQILLAGGGHRPVSDFALAGSLGNYVAKSGDTMTGKLTISSSTYQDHLELVRGSISFGIMPSTGNSGELRFLATNATRYLFDKVVAAPTFSGNLTGNATTATTLATSRTINGTSFNGSANITTARWGTARNITIGDTTKSVNGSANVSWSLAEIGAASSTSLNDYVPYTGANQTINFNTQDFTTGGYTSRLHSYFERINLASDSTSGTGNFKLLTNVAAADMANINQSSDIIITLPITTTTYWQAEIDILRVGYRTTLNIGGYNTSNASGFVSGVYGDISDIIEVKFGRIGDSTVLIIKRSASSINRLQVNISKFYYHHSNSTNLYNDKTKYKVEYINESELVGFTLNGVVANSQFTRDSYLWNKGDFTQTNVDNWDTAYGWGNHSGLYALVGRSIVAGNGLSGGGTLAANRTITLGTPTAIGLSTTNAVTSTSHTHALDSATTTAINNGNTAFGWGNHALAGYALAGSLGNYLPLAGGTMGNTATIHWSGSDYTTGIIHKHRNVTSGGFALARMSTDTHDKGLGISTTGDLVYGDWSGISSLSTSWNTVWHSGNLLQSSINNWNTAFGWGDFRDYGLGRYVSAGAGSSPDTLGNNTGFYLSQNSPTEVGGTHAKIINLGNPSASSVVGQIAIGHSTSRMAFRISSTTSWHELISTSNLDSQATSLGFIKSSALPTVNNGQLSLSTGTGLSGSATFTANQSGNSSFSVGIASTHKLPTVAEWNALSTQTLSSSTSNIISGNTVQRAALTGDVTASQNSNATTIANNAVTHAKYQNIPTQRILGRGATGTGNVQELTLGTGLTLSTAGVLSATNTSSGTVTSVGMTVAGAALTVSGSPITTSGTLALTWGGASTQYVRGDGSLATIPTNHVTTSRSITAGNGLSGGGTLAANRTITLGTPGAIGLSTTNSVTSTSHTHALDTATTTAINNGNTAFGWGNHASVGYLTSSTLPSMIGLSYNTGDNIATNSSVDVDTLTGSQIFLSTSPQNLPFSATAIVQHYTIASGTHITLAADYINGRNDYYLGSGTQTSVNSNWRKFAFQDWVLAQDYATQSQIVTPNNGQLTLSTGTGLTGSATFTANQSGSSLFSVGLSASTLASLALADTAVQPSALSGYVPTSRTITAGDGLSGGGNLTANRTISVDGTVVRTSGNQTITGNKEFSNGFFGGIATSYGNLSSLVSGGTSAGDMVTGLRVVNTGTSAGTKARVLFTLTTNAAWENVSLEADRFSGSNMRFNIGIGNGANPPINIAQFYSDRAEINGNLILGEQGTTTTQAVRADRTITAGNGLSGGGNLTSNRTITLGTPGAITLSSTNSVGTSSHTHAFNPGGTTAQYIRGDGSLATYANTTYSAGTGLSLSGTTFGQAITTSGTGTYVQSITQTASGFQVNLGTPPNTNTTYSAGTVSLLTAGTNTTNRVWRADYLNQGIKALTYNPDNLTFGSGLNYNTTTGVLSASSDSIFAYSPQGGLYTTNWSSNALGQYSLAVGHAANSTAQNATAVGSAVFTGGFGSTNVGFSSNVNKSLAGNFGTYNTNNHREAFTYGLGLQTASTWQTVIGRYNKPNGAGDIDDWTNVRKNPIFILGVGQDEMNRKNAVSAFGDGRLDYEIDRDDTHWNDNTLPDIRWINENVGGGGGSNYVDQLHLIQYGDDLANGLVLDKSLMAGAGETEQYGIITAYAKSSNVSSGTYGSFTNYGEPVFSQFAVTVNHDILVTQGCIATGTDQDFTGGRPYLCVVFNSNTDAISLVWESTQGLYSLKFNGDLIVTLLGEYFMDGKGYFNMNPQIL